MDPSRLPSAHFIPGRIESIEHAGRVDKTDFLVSTGVLFGVAILCAFARLTIRAFGKHETHWDDGFVLVATVTLAASYGVTMKAIDILYLSEAIQRQLVVPFREDILKTLELTKWATAFGFFNWTSVYMVKFAFQYFFHALIRCMPKYIIVLYWTTVGITVVSWLYTILCSIIICPHFGAESARCSANPNQHTRSLINNLLAACLDIITDILIVSLPVIILRQAMMPFSRKASLAAMLCLSVAMIVCALIRVIGMVATTRSDTVGAAPTWAWYWGVVESCIALTMTSVIVIRGAFITQAIHDGRKKQQSLVSRFGMRLLSILRTSISLRSLRRSPPRSVERQPGTGSNTPPQIPTQGLTRASLPNLMVFGEDGQARSESQTGLGSVDTAYIMEDLNYHKIRQNEARHGSV